MQFKRLNRDQPEQIFMTVQNNEGATLNVDDCVIWELAAASVDGVKVRQCDTGLNVACMGVLSETLADQAYGLVQVWGYRASSRIWQSNTSMATGELLIASAGAAHFVTVASNSGFDRVRAIVAESIASSGASGTVSRKIFLKGF